MTGSSLDDSSVTPPSTQAAASKPNTFQRIVGVVMSPVPTFDDIARRPDVLVPLILFVVISAIGTFLIVPRVDFNATYREAFENSNMQGERLESSVRMAAAVGKSLAYFGPVLQIIAFAVTAGVLLLAFRLFGGEGDFKQAFSATLYAWVPLVIKGMLACVVILSKKTITLNDLANPLRSNLAFLVNMKSNPIAFSLLGSLDIFTIWTIVLMIIGFAALSRMSRAKSAAIVISLWLVVVLFKVGGAALGAARNRA
ncbi:MAG: Yip1 family protein [Thermoanaerobaculia bacterium]